MKNCKKCLQPLPVLDQPFRSSDESTEHNAVDKSIVSKSFRELHPKIYNSIKNVLAVFILPAAFAIIGVTFYYVGLFCKSNGLCNGEICNDPPIAIGFTYGFIGVMVIIIIYAFSIIGKIFIQNYLE